ncbi:hypothetical protein C2845_PM04G14570 [Panicum miliaceum]|uniref:Uncharacterized protein n=1 Tax=Panicum miliaceum TaxID=4540 RepID=A0A3L6QU79_PANMI|nr:hypothetical protein C2845_PM04G14570 [Panicum miliaceum]
MEAKDLNFLLAKSTILQTLVVYARAGERARAATCAGTRAGACGNRQMASPSARQNWIAEGMRWRMG